MHYIFFIDGSSYKPMYEAMLRDVINMEDVSIVCDKRVRNRMKWLLLKRKAQFITKGYLDILGYEENCLFTEIKKQCELGKQVVVCFFNGALHHNEYLAGTLIRYKKKFHNLRYVLYYTDIINSAVSKNAYYLQKKNIFDYVYTVDEADSVRNSMILWPTLYSVEPDYYKCHLNQDIYFCGVSKGRGKLLIECLKEARYCGVDVAMDIICYDDDADDYLEYTDYIDIRTPDKYLSYPEVLRRELSAKCILEIVQKGQVALTLRPYEAVAYNKKLLTNNKTILNFKYYNPKYMRYFEKVEDIDWNWVKCDDGVDYNYQGDFSPRYLLADIEKNLSKK